MLSGDPDVTTYDITYTYDQLGNRETKTDSVSDLTVEYTYDVDLDPYDHSEWPGYPDTVYPTHNNRLLYYKVYDDQEQTLRTVSYVYYDIGHVSNIIVKDEYTGQGTQADYDWYRGLMFTYYGIGPSEAGLVLTERWKDDGQGGFSDHELLALREFRYHPDARGRFIVRDLDPNDDEREWSVEGAENWTDYGDAMPYTDFEVTLDGENDPVATDQTRYLNGSGTHAQYDIQGEETEYLHGDLIRSTNLTTDGSGDPVSSLAYTAFGEVIGTAPDTRYQYAGGWGYESDLLVLEGAPGTASINLQHLGYRWYQPDIGRFIQRDPIGIAGGLNVYAYCANDSLSAVDPLGLDRWCPICGCGSGGHYSSCPCYRPTAGPDVDPRDVVKAVTLTKPARSTFRELYRALRKTAPGVLGRAWYWGSRCNDFLWLLNLTGDSCQNSPADQLKRLGIVIEE